MTMINGWYGCDVVVGNDPWLVSRAVTDQKACSVWFGVWKYLVVKLKKHGEINSRLNTAVYAIYKSCKGQGIGPAR